MKPLMFFVAAVAGALCVLGGYVAADELTPQPPVVITLTLPDQGMSAEFICTQRYNYPAARSTEIPK